MENITVVLVGFFVLVITLGVIPPLLGYAVYKLSSVFTFLKMFYNYEEMKKFHDIGDFFVMGFSSYFVLFFLCVAVFAILGASLEIGKAILY